MTGSLTDLIARLRAEGIRLSVEGGRLIADCAPELMTGDVRSQIIPRKMAIILYLQRSETVRKRIGQAMLDAEYLYPDRFEWCRSNPEVTAAAEDVDRASAAYVEGAGSIAEVEKAWKRYTRTIDTRTREEKGETK